MWKYWALFQAVLMIIQDSPEFIETFKKIVKAIRDRVASGSASVMDLEGSANVVCTRALLHELS